METEKKIKIAIVFHDTIFTSGATRSMLDVVDRLLLNDKLELVCVFPRSEGTAIDYLKEKNVNIVSCRYWYCTGAIGLGFTEKLKLKLKLVLSYMNIWKLVRSDLRTRDIDLVYSNTGVILAGAWISQMLKKPHIWHIREFMEEDHGITTLFHKRSYYRFVNKNASKVVLISEALKKKYEAGIDNQKIRVIHDDLSANYLMDTVLPWEQRRKNILFAGTICEGKGQLVAIQALGILKRKGIEYNLNIAGTVKDRDKYYYDILCKEVEHNGLEKQVKFLGQVANLSEVRQSMGIGVVASRSEAFGRVTIEGMLAHMIMVGADAGGTTELITDSVNGFLYPLNDAEKLAAVLEHLWKASQQELDTIQETALAYGKRYIVGNCADKLTELMYACLGGRKE